jgi:iron complex outermembrane receptor protein
VINLELRKLSVFAFLLLGAPLLGAAQETTEADAAEATAEEEEREYDEITVTGSRIKRTEFTSSAPITIITNERSQLAGLLDSADVLQGSTVASGQQIDDSFSGFVTDGGTGANTISLRGLGAQRTLVLVNGKRWGPSGVRGSTNSVDLTAIPTSMIARYEILKDGASSVYGADAVAGVVNAITKERIDGARLNVQALTPEEGGSGYSIDGAWGRVGDNWSFNVSGFYGEIQRTVMTDRDFSRCDTRPRVDGANLDPATGEELCFGFIYGLQSGPFGFARYEPSLTDPNDTSNQYYDPDIQGFGIPFWTTVGVNPNPNQGGFYRDVRDPSVAEIQPPGETYSINSFGDYDFGIGGRSATAYYEFYYNNRNTDAVGGYRQFFPFVPATNPTNIMGTSGPLAGFGGFGVLSVLPSYEIQDPTNRIDIERTNTFVGLKGDISSSWTYDAYVGHSWSDGTYEAGNWLQGQVDASLDAELDGSGNLVCSAASLALYPDCVAGNLFTEDALLRGILPQDYLDFIGKTTKGTTEYTSQQFSGYVTGPMFKLPAGELQSVFGIEYRREEIDDRPDIDAQNDNIWGRTTAGITAGSDTVREYFVEFEAPLLKEMPFAEELTFNGSWRYTDYDSYGGDDTYRVALNYQIIPAFRVRATKGTSFRAPDLFEQFLENQTGFVSALGRDPCIDYGTNFDPSTAVYMNCASEGLAEDFGTGGTPSIRAVTGGNPNLVAETSDSESYGFVIQPESIGASLAVSWFDIAIKNTVASPSVGFVLGDCYSSTAFSSPFCPRVGPRDSMGFLTDVDASLLNVGLQASRGYDIDVLYEHEFSSFDLTVDFSATYIDEQTQEVLGELNDFEGKWGYPQWVAQIDFRADWRDWTFFYNIDWIDETSETPVDNRICATDAKTYQSLATRYRGSDWEIIGTVRNLANVDPPIVSDGCGSQTSNRVFNTSIGTGYDLIGRSFVLQASKSFDL